MLHTDRSTNERLSRVMEIVRTAARQLIGADGVTFVVRDGDHVRPLRRSAVGTAVERQRFTAHQCVSGWVITKGEAAVINEELQKEPPLFIPPALRRIWLFVHRSATLFEASLASAADSSPTADLSFHRLQISSAAERWLSAASAYEYEAEAYVFGLNSLRLRARWTVTKFYVRAWWKRRRTIAVR
jgi:hypothetical protein